MGRDRTPLSGPAERREDGDPVSILRGLENCLQMAVGLVTGIVLETDGAPDTPFAQMMAQVAEAGAPPAMMIGAMARVGQILVAGLAQHSGVAPAEVCTRLGQIVAELNSGLTIIDPQTGETFILRRGPR